MPIIYKLTTYGVSVIKHPQRWICSFGFSLTNQGLSVSMQLGIFAGQHWSTIQKMRARMEDYI